MVENNSGRVKWFNNAKGFGFIESPEVSGDIFVHFQHIVSSPGVYRKLSQGQVVNFKLVQGKNGLSAEEVVAVS